MAADKPREEQNPYRSPTEEPAPAATVSLRRGPLFRWRTIPAGVLAFSGVGEFAAGVLTLFLSILVFAFTKRPDRWYASLGASPIMVLAGVAWIKASQAWLRGKWRLAIILTLFGYVLNAVLPPLFAPR